MLNIQLERVRSILCLGAHADDIEIGCGGTILRLLAERPDIDVHWVVLGAQDRRAEEARRGAELFLRDARKRNVIVKGFRDSYFPYEGGPIKSFVHELSRDIAPDLIFTHRREDMHQDHRLTAELTWNAFRDNLILEYDIPKYEGDLGRPNFFVPLEESTCRRKVESIVEAYQSQHSKPWFGEDIFLSLLRIRGLECNSPTRFAEGLYCRKMTI